MGGSDVPSNTTTTNTTTNELPSWLTPYSTALLSRANALSNVNYKKYPGQQVAPLNALHNQALGMIQQRAANGSPLMTGANNLVQSELNGNFLNQGNPYLQNVIDSSNSDIVRSFTNGTMPQTDATMARQGAFGGSAWAQMQNENNRQLANELAKNTSNLRYNDYSNERQNQTQAIGQAQQLAQQPYTDASQLLGAGDVKRDYAQTLNDVNFQNWQDMRNQPYKNLDVLGNAVRMSLGNAGTTIQSSQLPRLNPAAGFLGGGLTGAMLGGQLASSMGGSTGMGMGLGGLLGGVAGAYG